MVRSLPLLLLLACDPYRGWPDPHAVFPWRVVDDQQLEPYEEVRWEEGPWDPVAEPELNGLYVQKALLHRPGTPTEATYHWGLMRPTLPPLVDDALQFSFVGDVLHTGDPPTDFAAAVPLLDGHLRIGNLETPVAPGVATPPAAPGVPRFNAPASLLDDLPLDLVQIANNHTLDVGDAGVEETLAQLDERGIFHAGVDGQIVLDFGDGLLVSVLAYTWGVNDPAATTAHDLAVVPFGTPGHVDLSRIAADLDAAREIGTSLDVVLVHWGYEYEYFADPHFLKIGREIVALGADLVVGAGSHTAQPAEWCTVNVPAVAPGLGRCSVQTDDGETRYAAILYGLGNFGTDQPTLPLQVGLVANVSLYPGVGVIGMGWDAVASVPDGDHQAVVPLLDLVDDDAYAAEAERLDAHLGTTWKR